MLPGREPLLEHGGRIRGDRSSSSSTVSDSRWQVERFVVFVDLKEQFCHPPQAIEAKPQAHLGVVSEWPTRTPRKVSQKTDMPRVFRAACSTSSRPAHLSAAPSSGQRRSWRRRRDSRCGSPVRGWRSARAELRSGCPAASIPGRSRRRGTGAGDRARAAAQVQGAGMHRQPLDKAMEVCQKGRRRHSGGRAVARGTSRRSPAGRREVAEEGGRPRLAAAACWSEAVAVAAACGGEPVSRAKARSRGRGYRLRGPVHRGRPRARLLGGHVGRRAEGGGVLGDAARARPAGPGRSRRVWARTDPSRRRPGRPEARCRA